MRRTLSMGLTALMLALMPIIFLSSLMASVDTAEAHPQVQPDFPPCGAEDEILRVGGGDYAHGYYAENPCVHPDTLLWEDETMHRAVQRLLCEHPRHFRRHHGIGRLVSEACHHDA